MRRSLKKLLVLATLVAPLTALVFALGVQAQAATTLTMSGTGAANAGLAGTVTITPAGANTVKVDIRVTGLAPNSGHAAHFHSPGSGTGACDTGGPVVYPFTDVMADAGGVGTSTSTVTFDATKGIPTAKWYANVHEKASADGTGNGIICGPITASLVAAAPAAAAPAAAAPAAQASPAPTARPATPAPAAAAPVAAAPVAAAPNNLPRTGTGGGAGTSDALIVVLLLAAVALAGTGVIAARHRS